MDEDKYDDALTGRLCSTLRDSENIISIGYWEDYTYVITDEGAVLVCDDRLNVIQPLTDPWNDDILNLILNDIYVTKDYVFVVDGYDVVQCNRLNPKIIRKFTEDCDGLFTYKHYLIIYNHAKSSLVFYPFAMQHDVDLSEVREQRFDITLDSITNDVICLGDHLYVVDNEYVMMYDLSKILMYQDSSQGIDCIKEWPLPLEFKGDDYENNYLSVYKNSLVVTQREKIICFDPNGEVLRRFNLKNNNVLGTFMGNRCLYAINGNGCIDMYI
jgi:hypothetical protein